MTNPLFVTGTARSGSTLLCRVLSANADVMVAADPLFILFRSLRNAIVRNCAPDDLQQSFDFTSPLQDYYFTDERIRIMDTIQAADLNIPFERQEWDSFFEASCARAQHECADLIPHMRGLIGPTYRDMFENGLKIIAQARRAENRMWVGCKEVWTIEFFAPLARAFPKARFIVLLRDPRAVMASLVAMSEADASQSAHILSYVRHWRKYIAFSLHYQNDPFLARRLYVLTYEQLVNEPETKARELCGFLGIRYDPDMTDPTKYIDDTTGGVWKGNSSFKKDLAGIEVDFISCWQTRLASPVLKLVEWTCGPDMQSAGYTPVDDAADRWPDPAALDYLIENDRQPYSWRSDLGDPQQDYGFELFRRALLTVGDYPLDHELIRRSFLFEEVFAHLRQRGSEARIV